MSKQAMTDHERHYYDLGRSGRIPTDAEFYAIMGYVGDGTAGPAFRRGRAERDADRERAEAA